MSLLASGCAPFYSSPVVPHSGGWFQATAQPVDITFEGNSIGSKRGEASTQQILGLMAWGDASIDAATDEGNLSRVDQIDSEFLNILGIYSRYTTVVYGE